MSTSTAKVRNAMAASSAPPPRSSSSASYLIAGVLFYGAVGWLLDQWLGTRFLVAVGVLLGAGLGTYLMIVQLNGHTAPQASTTNSNTDSTTNSEESE